MMTKHTASQMVAKHKAAARRSFIMHHHSQQSHGKNGCIKSATPTSEVLVRLMVFPTGEGRDGALNNSMTALQMKIELCEGLERTIEDWLQKHFNMPL